MIYLDYAATTPLRREVLAEMMPYWTEEFGNPDSLHAVGKPDFNACARIAVQLAGNSIYTADTLHALDQWIPFGYLRKEFPIYKFSFQDARKQQIYVSSQTGNVLQWTDRPARIWAYLGAIPHWVYFTGLRQHQPAWFSASLP